MASEAPKKPVLIIEDDEDVAATIAEVLEGDGFRATIAHDGREALALLENGLQPGLILLDMSMPVMNGWEFRQEQSRIQSATSVPVIVVTADGDAKRKADSIHAQGFLAKPVTLNALLSTVERTYAA